MTRLERRAARSSACCSTADPNATSQGKSPKKRADGARSCHGRAGALRRRRAAELHEDGADPARVRRARRRCRALLVHTGQHYDADMNDQLFVDLRPAGARHQPRSRLGHACRADRGGDAALRAGARRNTGRPVCSSSATSTRRSRARLVAVKKGVPVAHVEAGLRSFDRSMPEEINRVLTDQIADLLYTTERAAHDNLAREGIAVASASTSSAT